MGECGMGYEDFRRLTVPELEAVVEAHRRARESEVRDSWERTRTLAVMTMQPHCRKKLNALSLLPLPWDRGAQGRNQTKAAPSKDEALARFRELAALAAHPGGHHPEGEAQP